MFWKIGYLAFGILLGWTLSTAAFDPCDKPKSYDRMDHYQYNSGPKDKDAAMQFHWQDHQPSLHPR